MDHTSYYEYERLIEDIIHKYFDKYDLAFMMKSMKVRMYDRIGYHSIKHIYDVIKIAEDAIYNNSLTDIDIRNIYIAILYHDIIYIPGETSNELKSARLFYDDAVNLSCLASDNTSRNVIRKAITKTNKHNIPRNVVETVLFDADLYRILHNTYVEYLDDEVLICKEYSEYVPLNYYYKGRIKFLKHFYKKNEKRILYKYDFLNYIKFLKNKVANIGIYPGSFNPVHIGHIDISRKALKMFDQVILLVSHNPDKSIDSDIKMEFDERCNNIRKLARKIGISVCPIPNYVLTPVFMYNLVNDDNRFMYVLIRGLRDGYDLDYELKQERFMREIFPEMNLIYISGDPNYSHISSSSIRSLQKMNLDVKNPMITKLLNKYS